MLSSFCFILIFIWCSVIFQVLQRCLRCKGWKWSLFVFRVPVNIYSIEGFLLFSLSLFLFSGSVAPIITDLFYVVDHIYGHNYTFHTKKTWVATRKIKVEVVLFLFLFCIFCIFLFILQHLFHFKFIFINYFGLFSM